MRVTDRSLQESYLINYQATKLRLKNIQDQITSQSKINKPSDNPLGNSKVMRLNSQIESIAMYKSNIDSSQAILGTTLSAMGGIQKSVEDVMLKLTSIQNATADPVLSDFANQIDQLINTIYDYSNFEYDGNYVFAGTDYKNKPFEFNAGNTEVNIKNNINGERKVAISTTSTQKINITGEELFQSVIKSIGNLDATDAGPFPTTQPAAPVVSTIYNSSGTEYALSVQYQKTAANTYTLNYSVSDTTPAVVFNGTINNLVFNTTTGILESIDGNSPPKSVRITNAGTDLDFVIDPTKMVETNSAASITTDKNQDSDIFSLLLNIRDNLKNSIRPSEQQVAMVNNFNKHIIGKLSEGGNIQNRLQTTSTLLENQDYELLDLLSKEKDIDMAKKIIELQTEEFNLNTVYRVSSMILPKSLLDYI